MNLNLGAPIGLRVPGVAPIGQEVTEAAVPRAEATQLSGSQH